MTYSVRKRGIHSFFFIFLTAGIVSCSHTTQEQASAESKRKLPVLTLAYTNAAVNTEYPARIEGKVNVDIRSQADGYIERIFVDEGAFVEKGQSLFKINDRPLIEQLNTAKAALNAARASLITAELEVERAEELSRKKVVSDFQLRAAKASFENAKATVSQLTASVEAARVNLDFALIKAPVSGYIGRIPKRIGNLVGRNDAEPLTTLSDIREVYTYFSVTEKDFLRFMNQYKEEKFADKVAHMPEVTLYLADGEEYPVKGKIQMIDGQFNPSTGAISMRAAFDNTGGILRSGNTGKIILPEQYDKVLCVPVLATLDVQHKLFVYRLDKNNRAERVVIEVNGKSGENYIVKSGLNAGDRILTKDINLLREGEEIIPK